MGMFITLSPVFKEDFYSFAGCVFSHLFIEILCIRIDFSHCIKAPILLRDRK